MERERAVAIRVLRPNMIGVELADGTMRQIELRGEVVVPLRDPTLFAQATLNPTLGSRPTGADLAPEFPLL